MEPETPLIQIVTPIADAENLLRVPEAKKDKLAKVRTDKDGKLVSKSADVKESYFRAFLMSGGIKRLVQLIEQKKQGKTKDSRSKAALADKRFLEYCYRVLPGLFPKKTELEVERRSVIFVFGDGKKETFEAIETVVDAEVGG
jgi:hypothetical protein